MSDENQQPTSVSNPYEVYRKYCEEQTRIWTNWWSTVLKTVWGMKK